MPPLDTGTDRYDLSGTVERVTFHNPDTGFSVLKVKARGHQKPVAVVAHAPSIEPGERLRARGTWVHDPKYGLQFKAEEVSSTLPRTVDGIERYLGSGLVDGVGPVHAAKLVEAFGEQTLDVIERQPWRLRQVAGIGPVRAESIRSAWTHQQSLRDLVLFLGTHGIAPERALRIHQAYGGAALARVSADPYRVAADVRGFGFEAADGLAQSLGLAPDDPQRLQAGLRHLLDAAAEEGSCGLLEAELLDRAAGLLGAETPKLARALATEVDSGSIVVEELGGERCVFPAWLHRTERSVANRLVALSRGTLPWPAFEVTPALASLAVETGMVLAPSQQAALEAVLRSKVCVMTGGPGVGKTTLVDTVVKVLRARGVEVALAAPTGRAAKRLAEATGHEARTIHRLLEVDPNGGFRRNQDRPLPIDLLVVDEVSMLDVRLMASLLAALPLRAALLLVGDVDQLPSVGPGRVLGDVIASGTIPVVRLREVFRQAAESRIIQAAHRVNAGERPLPPAAGEESDFYLVESRNADGCLDKLMQMVTKRIPERFGLDPLRDVQVICPMNKGGLGTRALNAALQQALNPPTGPRLHRGPYAYAVGDKVMQVENDHEQDVFNGDMGVVTAVDLDNQALTVEFDGRPLRYAGGDLERLSLAYAVTVHKAQGSEYPAVVIPLTLQHAPLLQRTLLYTGITRGRKLVVLVGDGKALDHAVRNVRARPRRSTLATRLKEALAQARKARTSWTATPAMEAPSYSMGQQLESVLTGTSNGG